MLRLALFRGIQGTESLWLDSQLSVVDVPSRDWSPGGNRDFAQGQSIIYRDKNASNICLFFSLDEKLKRVYQNCTLK